MTETTTPQGQSNAVANVPAVDPNGTGSVTDEVLTVKDFAKQITGNDFPDDETALQSLKDLRAWGTQNAQKVSQLTEQLNQVQSTASPEALKRLETVEAALRDQNFYSAHPEYNKPQIRALITDMGGNPTDVIAKDSFKTAVTAINKTLEMDESQSILHSNPRIGQVQDSMTKAKEQLTAGNQTGAIASAMDSVLNAYPQK